MKFFKKNLLLFISWFFTIVAIVLVLFTIEEGVFPDTVIQKQGKDYADSFVASAKNVEANLLQMKVDVDSAHFFDLVIDEKIKFLIEHLESDKTVSALMVLDHSGRFSTLRRDKNTYVFASDSASKIDNVTWYRINKDRKVLNSWVMALGMELNILKWGAEVFNESYRYQMPLWSSSHSLFGISKGNIVTHLTWKSEADSQLVTCLATLNENSFISKGVNVFNDSYQSLLINLKGQIIPLHLVDDNDSDTSNQNVGVFSTSVKSWEVTGGNIPGTYSFNYKNDIWWGQSLSVPIDGLQGIIINASEQALYYSLGLNHLIEFIIILVLITISIVLTVRARRSKHQSLEEFVINQVNDKHVSDLVKQGESLHLEFKSSFRYDYHLKVVNKELEGVIAKSIAAFSNGKGGTLLIGVDDDGNVLGLENDINTLKRKDIDFFENNLRMFLNKAFSISFVTQNLEMRFPVLGNKAICRIDVIASNEPVFVEIAKNSKKSERFYLRSGNTSQEIVSLREINEYVKDRFSDN